MNLHIRFQSLVRTVLYANNNSSKSIIGVKYTPMNKTTVGRGPMTKLFSHANMPLKYNVY